MQIKPVPGRQVPDPEKGGCLPPEGRIVGDFDQYWLNRLADGDVVKVETKSSKKGGE